MWCTSSSQSSADRIVMSIASAWCSSSESTDSSTSPFSSLICHFWFSALLDLPFLNLSRCTSIFFAAFSRDDAAFPTPSSHWRRRLSNLDTASARFLTSVSGVSGSWNFRTTGLAGAAFCFSSLSLAMAHSVPFEVLSPLKSSSAFGGAWPVSHAAH